mmetsp:Transcript_22045/g.55514  ORF Transcript_22045/g.55514 Transcript_22045/m.55514 type:complete len:552 (-) Transcript_22045:228-1883(-)
MGAKSRATCRDKLFFAATAAVVLLCWPACARESSGRRLRGFDNSARGAEAGPEKWPCAGRGTQFCNATAQELSACPRPCQPGNCRTVANRDFWKWEEAVLAGAYDNVFVREDRGPRGDICASVCRSDDRNVVTSAQCLAGRRCGSVDYCSVLDCPPPLSYASCRRASAFWEPTCEVCTRLFPACAVLLGEPVKRRDRQCGEEEVFIDQKSPDISSASGTNPARPRLPKPASPAEEDARGQVDDVEAAEESPSQYSCESEPEGVCIREFTPGEMCRQWTPRSGESTMPYDVTVSPYADVIVGNRSFEASFPGNKMYPNCRFVVPPRALPSTWVEECINNMQKIDFLNDGKERPTPPCPAGWFICQGMCYTIVQRQSVGPTPVGEAAEDYMSLEARCGLCGGARVAFVGEDPGMQAVAAEAARLSRNRDRAVWVRRFRFLPGPNWRVESRSNPFQPWHRYVTMAVDDPWTATYQRFYTGELDGLTSPGYDARFRNQDASILCVNTIPRTVEASHDSASRIEKKTGCLGEGAEEMWANEHHRWWPESNYPYPGL